MNKNRLLDLNGCNVLIGSRSKNRKKHFAIFIEISEKKYHLS
jgi:hypothetical protein